MFPGKLIDPTPIPLPIGPGGNPCGEIVLLGPFQVCSLRVIPTYLKEVPLGWVFKVLARPTRLYLKAHSGLYNAIDTGTWCATVIDPGIEVKIIGKFDFKSIEDMIEERKENADL